MTSLKVRESVNAGNDVTCQGRIVVILRGLGSGHVLYVGRVLEVNPCNVQVAMDGFPSGARVLGCPG